MDECHDPCICGKLKSDLISGVTHLANGKEVIVDINFVLGRGTLRPYPIHGRLLLMQAETYDIIAFYLLRQLFKLYFPMIISVKFSNFEPWMLCQLIPPPGIRYIATKIFDDRPLDLADYYPACDKNFQFRYQLCLIIFFCKMVGCPLSLHDIRVLNGYPFFWQATYLGLPNSRTVTESEFSYLFGIPLGDARRVYVGQSRTEINASTLSDTLTSKYTQHEKQEYVNLRSPMFDEVIKYFREVGFEPDLVRACLYIRENPVRSSTGNRAKFKLSIPHAKILKLIEENCSLLSGPYPFKVFRVR